MSKKKGNFVDQFLDKIILGLAGAIALYMLWTFVLSNPYGQKAGNKKLSPSEIDHYNKDQSKLIEKKLQESASTNPYVQDKTTELSSLIGSSMPKLSIAANWPLPGGGQMDLEGDREYAVPQIPVMENIKLASIRGTVRMPTEDVTPEISYMSVAAKPEDLDLVTLSARLNLQTLYNNFRQSFVGMRLKPQWRDPTYAEPVLSRIELQRCVQNSDGSWGAWQTVPFIRIDPYQKMFKELPLTTDQMTYGSVTLFMNSYKEFAVMKDILQPATYEYLTTQIKWLPAEYYLEYRKISEEEEARRIREERERRLRERDAARGVTESRRTPTPTQLPRRGGRDENIMMDGIGGGVVMPVKPTRPIRTVQDIERDTASVMINENTKLNTLKDILVWIHDDTVVAGATYRYRVRYGVFNPIAGKDWFAQDSQQYKNHVVLWSGYSELPEPVSIPKMLHLFPMDVLADGRGVNIDVYRYYLGQWHTESFKVYPGQIIGKPKESTPSTSLGIGGDMGMMNPVLGMNVGGPQPSVVVDYSTGYMLMDVQTATDWSSPGVRPRDVPSMLYLDSDNRIMAMAAKKAFWTKELNAEYNTVRQEMQRTAGTLIEGIGIPGMEGGTMPPGMTTQVRDVGL